MSDEKRPVRRGSSDDQGSVEYHDVLDDIVGLLEQARSAAARSVNTVMTATYWQIGRRIVEDELSGKPRAAYGEGLLDRLAADLTRRFGRGFSRPNLTQMRQFYLARDSRRCPSQ